MQANPITLIVDEETSRLHWLCVILAGKKKLGVVLDTWVRGEREDHKEKYWLYRVSI